MASRGYKKYMKKEAQKTSNPFIKIFIISFFGMLLIFTMLFNYISKVVTVDTSIGDYKESAAEELEEKKIIDVNRLEMIQNEDQGRNFTDLMKNPSDEKKQLDNNADSQEIQTKIKSEDNNSAASEPVYKVFIGSYTSAEQAKAAKEIIQESGTGFSPIVKCLGANNYTLQVGIFKNKQSAETMLMSIQSINMPGRIVQEN